jgi:hypothetical protein
MPDAERGLGRRRVGQRAAGYAIRSFRSSACQCVGGLRSFCPRLCCLVRGLLLSGAGGHVGGEDVVGVAVEVDRHEGMPQHMGVWPGDPQACLLRETPQAAGGGMAVHPGTAAVEQDRAARPVGDSAVDGPADRRGSGTRTILVPLPHTRSTRWPCSSPRSLMSAPAASKIRRPSSPSMVTSAKLKAARRNPAD